MNYDYNQLFAKEYSGYSRIRHGAEEAFRALEGCRLTAWRSDASLGIHALEFGTKSLLIWYKDSDHCKIRIGPAASSGEPSGLSSFDGLTDCTGMELHDFYVLMGEEPMLCLSFSDAFFHPENRMLRQYIISSEAGGYGVQSTAVPDESPFRRISTERVPTTRHFRKVIRNEETGEQFVSLSDEDGGTLIPPIYNDIELFSTEKEIYRTSIRKVIPGGTDYDLFGLCDETGKEIIPCIYPDLYYMANGFVLVMGYRHKWWVLNEKNEALFGPHNQGVDIYSRNREYLYYIEYNKDAQCEALGIYSVELRTELTDADYIRIQYLGDDTFRAQKIFGPGDVRTVLMDPYGKTIPESL